MEKTLYRSADSMDQLPVIIEACRTIEEEVEWVKTRRHPGDPWPKRMYRIRIVIEDIGHFQSFAKTEDG